MVYIDKIQHSQVLDLKTEVPIEEEQMLSKTLVQRKDLGMTIFSLDKDLKTMDDLLPLSELEQKHNFQCYCSNRIYNDDFMPMLIEK